MNLLDLILRLEYLQENTNSYRDSILSLNCKISKDDRRFTIFTQLFGILDRSKMGFEFAHLSLESSEIKTRMFAELNEIEFLQRINSFVHFISLDMNLSLFNIIEAFLRQTLREMNLEPPNAFSQVTSLMIESLDLEERWSDFSRIYSLIRNTLHNNGVYFPSAKKDGSHLNAVRASYRGKDYVFEYGKQFFFLDGELRLQLAEDGCEFAYEICRHPDILQRSHMSDPSHFMYWPVYED